MTLCYGRHVERDGWVSEPVTHVRELYGPMMTTYRREDGEPIGDYDFVTDYEWISEGLEPYLDDPVVIVRETWERVTVARKVIGERDDDDE